MAALMLVSFVMACTTTEPVDVATPTDLTEEVQPKDWVAITTHDGRKLEFRVTAVEPDAIIGETERVQRDEIAELEVTRVSEGRTLAVVGGGFLLLIGIWGFMAAAATSAGTL